MNGPLPPNGIPHSMGGRGGPPPSPPISIAARSSNGSSPYPRQGPDGPGMPPQGGKKYNPQMLEAQLADHHRVLKDYLATSLREDQSYMPHNRARDKLLRLSPIQFQELSTDVYDELLRREDERAARGPNGSGQSIPRFLLPKNNFHPKRNQARQKLSTLASKKFRELATDVLFELERRFPRFTGADRVANRGGSRPPTGHGMGPPPSFGPHGMRRPSNASSVGPYSPGILDGRSTPGGYMDPMGRPPPNGRPFQSNTMVPNKSTMVEDEDDHSGDDDDPYDLERAAARSSRRTTKQSLSYSVRDQAMNGEYQTQISSLESKVNELEGQLRDKDKVIGAERERSSVLTENLERQLKSVESLNGSLQTEIDRLKADRDNDDWRGRYEHLEQDYHEQRHITEEVRTNAASSLQEMRSLAQRVNQRSGGEEQLVNQVTDLEATIETWKNRHAKTRAHLRSLRATSMGFYIQQPNAPQFAKEGGFIDAKGLVRDTSVTHFQLAIDELLQLSHGDEPNQVLPYMRNIVSCVRAVTGDINQSATNNLRIPKDVGERRKKLEARVAATSNNLITTAKNHATAGGLAPVALMDAAASHLTMAIVELVKVVKVRPTPEGELMDQDDFR